MTWQWDDVRFFPAGARAGPVRSCTGFGFRSCDGWAADYAAREEARRDTAEPTPDDFVTTSAGEAILRQCAAMESDAMDLERIAAGRDKLLAGAIRVTTTEGLAYSW